MEEIEPKSKIEPTEEMRPNLRSGSLEIIRNDASPYWSTFPKSLQPMDSPVISTNQK